VRVLTVNAGSSSLKLRLLDEDDSIVASRDLPALDGDGERDLLYAIGDTAGIDGVGHRVVHGGTRFTTSVELDAAIEEELASLIDLAPLHQPRCLAGIRAVQKALPDVPAVACFDTAFHSDLPAAAFTYAVPDRWREQWAIRRYGFHGLSHSYCSRRAAEILERGADEVRIVTCHLGAGSSLAAVAYGRSVDTTMGFTPLEGLVMATRSGSIDPGIVLWIQEHIHLTASDVRNALERESGLLALGGTGDMRSIIEAAESGDDRSRLALDIYGHHLRKAIAGMAAAMGGVDVVAFTGGVGQNAPDIRAEAVKGLSFLGLALDAEVNREGTGDRVISAPTVKTAAVVVEAREDVEIAREVRLTVRGRA
jgi:acetate kinase